MGTILEKFTQRARRALSLAQAEARALKHLRIWPAHILLGLMRENAGVASIVLAGFGTHLDQVRRVVDLETPASEKSATQDQKMTLGESTQAMLLQSIEIARQRGHQFISTEHLLMALAAVDDSRTQAILGRLGLSGDVIHNRINQILNEEPPPAGKPSQPGEPEALLATLDMCRRLLASEADPVHLEQLSRIEGIIRRYFDLPVLPGLARGISLRFSDDALVVQLDDGREVSTPLSWFPRLRRATPEQRQAWRWMQDGRVIRWEALNQDILLRRILWV